MEQARLTLLERIRDYKGEKFVNERLGAQLYNDSTVSFGQKAFIWFDRNIMRFKELRDLGWMPWYGRQDPITGKQLDPLLDFVFDEAKWPRHITRFADMENFLFQIDFLYHIHCMDDLLYIDDCPLLGDGHLGTFTKRDCNGEDVMRKVFGVLEHFEEWDFNVLLANRVSSLFQNEMDEKYGEGSLLWNRGFYLNEDIHSPFRWCDYRMKKETKTSVSRLSKVKIMLPERAPNDCQNYLDINCCLSDSFENWQFPHVPNPYADGVILICKGINPKEVRFNRHDEVKVSYNAAKGKLGRQVKKPQLSNLADRLEPEETGCLDQVSSEQLEINDVSDVGNIEQALQLDSIITNSDTSSVQSSVLYENRNLTTLSTTATATTNILSAIEESESDSKKIKLN